MPVPVGLIAGPRAVAPRAELSQACSYPPRITPRIDSVMIEPKVLVRYLLAVFSFVAA